MKENEEKLSSTAAQKEKIRQRYRGVNSDELDVIPAIPQTNFYEDQREKRVAVYARVSTDDPRQTSSYELQKNHYQDVVSRHPGWKLIEIYALLIFYNKKSHNPLGLEKLYTNKTKRVKMLEAEQQAAQSSQPDAPSGTQMEMFTEKSENTTASF